MPLTRRSLLASAAAAGAAPLLTRAGWAFGQDGDWVRVVVLVIDGLRPDEIGIMPNLSQIATDGHLLPFSRAHMIAETTPNHVSMLTGVRADRHGMPGNGVAYLPDNVGESPRYLQCDSLFTLMARQSPLLAVGTATSKVYIVEMTKHDRDGDGQPDADVVADPFFYVPISDAAIDADVATQAVSMVGTLDPDFAFVSYGDVDRAGHSDATGGPIGQAPPGRTASLLDADEAIRRLVDALQADEELWARTVMLITADHSMDWSTPDSIVNLTGQFEEEELLAGHTGVAQNGGAAIFWLLTPDEPRSEERLMRMREIALATEGVAEAWYTAPNGADPDGYVGIARPDWGLTGDRTGDLVVTVADGYRITEPAAHSNFIPGNHGHIVTLPIAMIVWGGWDGIVPNDLEPGTPAAPLEGPAPDVRLPDQGQNIDVASTVAWLMGLHPPPGGFDGRVLEEAFSRRPTPRYPVADVPSLPAYRQVAGSGRVATAAELSRLAFPDPEPVHTVVVASAEDFPDALAATPLAVALGAPLLLTGRARLDEAARAEVERLTPDQAIVVGGTAALSEAVADDLAALGVAVTRLADRDRFGTAAAIARHMAPQPGLPDVVLASGEGFPDALTAGVLRRPILLTRQGSLPEPTRQALADLATARVLIAGGSAAVATAVEDVLRADGLIVERIGGPNRYDTAARLVERAVREGAPTDLLHLVSGADFPDALAAGAAVGARGGLLVPVSPAGLDASPGVADLLARRSDQFVEVVYVGGTSAMPQSVRDEVQALLLARRTRVRRPR
ncbi:MAG: cell wall-binding repeat-containing protein [Actinobacteria bacterium]|nr:cell wall-binding repeat-containing protein [Actinomycetota bacterium]